MHVNKMVTLIWGETYVAKYVASHLEKLFMAL